MVSVIHIVDDDASLRTAVGRLLRSSGYDVVEHASASELLEQLPDNDSDSCILLDVQMPGLSGPEFQHKVLNRGSTVPIIFLTGYGDIPMTVHAIKAGADDFLTKPVDGGQLLHALDQAFARRQMISYRTEQLSALRHRLDALTRREFEVFELVIRGRMNKQIAYQLKVTERTVKAHRHNVMQKTGARSVAELVSMAERLGILSQPAEILSSLDTPELATIGH